MYGLEFVGHGAKGGGPPECKNTSAWIDGWKVEWLESAFVDGSNI